MNKEKVKMLDEMLDKMGYIYKTKLPNNKYVAICLHKLTPRNEVIECLLFQANFPIIGYDCHKDNVKKPYNKRDIKYIRVSRGKLDNTNIRADLHSINLWLKLC